MIILILIYFMLLPVSSFASDDWLNLGIYGGQMNAIAVNPENSSTIYLGAYYGEGLYKSNDGGQNWNPVSGFRNKTIDCIKISPQDTNYIWLTRWGYFSLSKDSGETWWRWDLDYDGYFTSIGLNPADKNIVYVGATGVGQNLYSEGRMYKCTLDSELTIHYNLLDYTFFGVPQDIEVDPQNSSKIWGVTYTPTNNEGRVCYTEDGGENWHSLSAGEKGFFALEINPQNPDIVIVSGVYGIYRTKDGGGNWTGVHNGLGNWCRALKIHPKNPLIVYAGAASYLLKSTDGGENWSELQTPIEEIISLDVDPDNSNIIYAGGLRTGVYKSIDGGVTWTEINSGVKSNHVYDSDVIYSNERFIIAGAMGGIYTKTSDEDWEHSGQSYFSSVKIDKQNPNLLYAGTDYYLWKSTDYGKNWTQTEIPSSYSTAYQVRSIDIDPVYPQNLYAGLSYYGGTWGEIYKSYDYGGSFSLLFQAPVPVNSIAISQDTDKTKIFAGTGNFYAPVISGNLYKSEDNGITWEKTKLRNLVINTIFVDSTNPKFILVGCGDSTTSNYKILYKSEDGGSTWEEGITNLETPISAVTDIKQDEGSPNIFYIATFKDGIYVSYDRMETAELIGLSDYNLYDLSTAYGNETPSGSSKSTLNKTLAQTVYSGTGSGMYQYTPAGIGQLTGKVIDSSTGSGIMGAQVSAGAGGTKTIDTDGYYLLGLPSGTYSITAQKNGYSKGTINSIIVSSGGVTLCPDISLEPGGSTCPAEALLSGEAKKLNNLRLFRDNLKNSSRGLEYISIYYRNGNKFLEIINNSPSLRDEARSLLNKFIEESPEFTSSGNFNLSPELKFKLNEFVNKIEKKADKDLKGDIKRLKRDFNL